MPDCVSACSRWRPSVVPAQVVARRRRGGDPPSEAPRTELRPRPAAAPTRRPASQRVDLRAAGQAAAALSRTPAVAKSVLRQEPGSAPYPVSSRRATPPRGPAPRHMARRGACGPRGLLRGVRLPRRPWRELSAPRPLSRSPARAAPSSRRSAARGKLARSPPPRSAPAPVVGQWRGTRRRAHVRVAVHAEERVSSRPPLATVALVASV